MKRDMDLVRKILLEIEEKYVSTAIYGLEVEGYDTAAVAYHCKILYEAGLISDYKAAFGDDDIECFGVGSLTWDGHDYLDKVRDDTLWAKTKDTIVQKGLPLILDTIKTVSSALITAAAEGVANSILKNGGAS